MSKKMLATLTAEHLVVLEMADMLRADLDKLRANEGLGQCSGWAYGVQPIYGTYP